jgi:hypothetical protein
MGKQALQVPSQQYSPGMQSFEPQATTPVSGAASSAPPPSPPVPVVSVPALPPCPSGGTVDALLFELQAATMQINAAQIPVRIFITSVKVGVNVVDAITNQQRACPSILDPGPFDLDRQP